LPPAGALPAVAGVLVAAFGAISIDLGEERWGGLGEMSG
jgi:hypothetical protein